MLHLTFIVIIRLNKTETAAEYFCLFEDVTGYRDIRRINLKSLFPSDSSFLLLNSIRQTLLAG